MLPKTDSNKRAASNKINKSNNTKVESHKVETNNNNIKSINKTKVVTNTINTSTVRNTENIIDEYLLQHANAQKLIN